MIHNKAGHYVAQWFGRHRRAWVCRMLGESAYFLWRAYENRNFNLHTNGEEWLLREMGKALPVKCVFDVGANIGDWLAVCRKYNPACSLHAFEIAPLTFAKLRENTAAFTDLTINPVGLSDENREIEVFCDDSFDQLATAFPELFSGEFEAFKASDGPKAALKTIKARVVRGDDYAREKQVAAIDFLKVDVEGMEQSVLRGFEGLFRQRKIRLVQFEYNTTNIVSKFLLRDAHHFFGEFGYRVGKLYPNYVEFRKYHYRHEDFCGLNMIAVHKDDVELQNLLKPRD